MSATIQGSALDTIEQLVEEANKSSQRDQRLEQRYPFFRPVAIRVGRTPISAFSRDIGITGIGLLHNVTLPLGEHEIAISRETGQIIRVRTRIEWCESCGDGWFLSGGQFVAAPEVADRPPRG